MKGTLVCVAVGNRRLANYSIHNVRYPLNDIVNPKKKQVKRLDEGTIYPPGGKLPSPYTVVTPDINNLCIITSISQIPNGIIKSKSYAPLNN
jgi:hypothetical protein